MATVKIKFRPSTKEGTIFYKVIHKRVAAQVRPILRFTSQNGTKQRVVLSFLPIPHQKEAPIL